MSKSFCAPTSNLYPSFFGDASIRTSDSDAGVRRFDKREKSTTILFDIACSMIILNETLKIYCCNFCLKYLQHRKSALATSKHVKNLLLAIR